VHHKAVLAWLKFLKANNPLYADIDIDWNALGKLPDDGDVSDQLRVVIENEDTEECTEGTGTKSEENKDEEEEDDDDHDVGPKQGGATGTDGGLDKDDVRESYLGAPADSDPAGQLEADIVAEVVR